MKKARRGYNPPVRRKVSIGVFLGGDNASESTALKLAESYIEEKYGDQYEFRYETITAQDLWRDISGHADLEIGFISIAQTTPWDFVEMLREHDIHWILSHPSQGGVRNLNWHVKDLADALASLADHPGFPFSNELTCDIFLQNKVLTILLYNV